MREKAGFGRCSPAPRGWRGDRGGVRDHRGDGAEIEGMFVNIEGMFVNIGGMFVNIERMFASIEEMVGRSSGCSLPSRGWREDRGGVPFHRGDGGKIEGMFASIEGTAGRSKGCSLPSRGWREDRRDVRFHRGDGGKIEGMFASIEGMAGRSRGWREDRGDVRFHRGIVSEHRAPVRKPHPIVRDPRAMVRDPRGMYVNSRLNSSRLWGVRRRDDPAGSGGGSDPAEVARKLRMRRHMVAAGGPNCSGVPRSTPCDGCPHRRPVRRVGHACYHSRVPRLRDPPTSVRRASADAPFCGTMQRSRPRQSGSG